MCLLPFLLSLILLSLAAHLRMVLVFSENFLDVAWSVFWRYYVTTSTLNSCVAFSGGLGMFSEEIKLRYGAVTDPYPSYGQNGLEIYLSLLYRLVSARSCMKLALPEVILPNFDQSDSNSKVKKQSDPSQSWPITSRLEGKVILHGFYLVKMLIQVKILKYLIKWWQPPSESKLPFVDTTSFREYGHHVLERHCF